MTIDKIVDPLPEPRPPRGFLKGRTALVTGGARRLGRAMVLALAHEGCDVVLHYRGSQDEAEETAGRARETGAQVWLVQGDLADPAAAAGLVARAAGQAQRPVDILVNNASIFAPGDLATTTLEQWEANQAVNLRAPFLLAQGLAANLADDQPGDIINLNDIRVLDPGADHFPYTISKVGLHGLTRSLARALAPRVRVNELALGAVLPPEKASADYMHTLKSQILTDRFPQVQDVTSALLFLLGNPALTGQTLAIDGGRK
jgi:NAD(P)-dependent dehydrogenase (short-subunit alcohol dehydrogenase family)